MTNNQTQRLRHCSKPYDRPDILYLTEDAASGYGNPSCSVDIPSVMYEDFSTVRSGCARSFGVCVQCAGSRLCEVRNL